MSVRFLAIAFVCAAAPALAHAQQQDDAAAAVTAVDNPSARVLRYAPSITVVGEAEARAPVTSAEATWVITYRGDQEAGFAALDAFAAAAQPLVGRGGEFTELDRRYSAVPVPQGAPSGSPPGIVTARYRIVIAGGDRFQERAQALLTEAQKLGQSMPFILERRAAEGDDVRRAAFAAAFEEARRDAEAIATAAGLRLQDIQQIDELPVQPPTRSPIPSVSEQTDPEIASTVRLRVTYSVERPAR